MAEDAARELPNLPLGDAWQLVHLCEGTPSLWDVAKVTASLASASSRRAG
jgi:hypothetical protein